MTCSFAELPSRDQVSASTQEAIGSPGAAATEACASRARAPQQASQPLVCLLSLLCMGVMGASLVAQLVKNPPAIQETWVQSLSWEDLLEKGMTPHSSILA